ncbi:hypothetical protein BGZ65_007014, partial [Modicella reniformis]
PDALEMVIKAMNYFDLKKFRIDGGSSFSMNQFKILVDSIISQTSPCGEICTSLSLVRTRVKTMSGFYNSKGYASYARSLQR